MTPKVIYLLMDCETISCSKTVKNVFKAPSNIYDGSFAKIVTNVNFKPLTCIIDEFHYFSLTSISRDTVKWLLSRFIFPVIKGQCYWPWKKSFHSWKVFQSWMVCFSRFYKYLEWKPILRMKNKILFPVVSQSNLVGCGGKIVHLNIERNEIEFAHAC